MKVIFGIGKVKRISRSVVAIGVFDGLHRGHLRILRELIKFSRRIRAKSAVITFIPHPQRDLNIYSLSHRIKLLEAVGIDICIVIKFTEFFSRIRPCDFVENFLIKKIRPETIFVGKNFTFGRGARGNCALLKKYADKDYFNLKVFPIYKLNGRQLSSSYIRRLILKGRLLKAQRLLGRPVSILGQVTKGSGLASRLGFPTANIRSHNEVLSPSGVYAVRVVLSDKKFNGICYIGTKPTFNRRRSAAFAAKKDFYIEAHIFGFNKNLYGKNLEVQFFKKIRGEKKFASAKSLADQVKKDIHLARLAAKTFPPLSPPTIY